MDVGGLTVQRDANISRPSGLVPAVAKNTATRSTHNSGALRRKDLRQSDQPNRCDLRSQISNHVAPRTIHGRANERARSTQRRGAAAQERTRGKYPKFAPHCGARTYVDRDGRKMEGRKMKSESSSAPERACCELPTGSRSKVNNLGLQVVTTRQQTSLPYLPSFLCQPFFCQNRSWPRRNPRQLRRSSALVVQKAILSHRGVVQGEK